MRATGDLKTGSVVVLATLALLLSAVQAVAAPAAPAPGWTISSLAQPTNFASLDTVQQVAVDARGGTYTLTSHTGGATQTTAAIAYDASAAELQTAIEGLSAFGAGNVSVSGGPGDRGATSPYVVRFDGSLAGMSVAKMTANSELLAGGITRTAAVSTITEGAQGASSSGRNYYVLVIRNAGSVASSGPVTITDTLPPGLEATSITPDNAEEFSGGSLPSGFSCTLATLTCTDTHAVPALGMLTVTITVKVLTSLPENVTNSATISGGGAPSVSTDATLNEVNALTAPLFGSPGIEFDFAGLNGEPDTQAGDHPYQVTVSGYLNTVNPPPSLTKPSAPSTYAGGGLDPVQNVKDVVAELPLGFVGNPQAAPTCNQSVIATAEFPAGSHGVVPGCPPGSQIGYVALEQTQGFYPTNPQAFTGDSQDASNTKISMLYNITPEHGYPAEFGFSYLEQVAFLYPSLNYSKSGYVLRVSVPGVPRAISLLGFSFTFFGNPLLQDGVSSPGKAFLTNPTDCADGPPQTVFHFDSWPNPAPVALNPDGSTDLNEADYEDPQWATATSTAPQTTGCGLLQFEPSIEFEPSPSSSVEPGTTQADTPSSYTFGLTVPQKEGPTELATPELKNATVTLPAGVSLSPPTADGLVACSNEEIDLDSEESGSCPEASKIGTVKITTPLLASPLEGSVYVGEPECGNAAHPVVCDDEVAESGRLYRLVIQAEGSGVNVKLLGTVKANPVTGQLTAEFKENPQLPFSHLELKLKGGQRAPLANPQECGTFTTTSELSPWSAPETPDGKPESSFVVDGNGAGGPCPSPLPFSPSFAAGTLSPAAGAYSPFTLTFAREDGEQDLGGLTLQMPAGLLGKLQGVTQCAEPQAAQGSCPASSQIGHVTATAGSGADPLVVPEAGQPEAPVYLTGSYKSAPFGLSIVVPAIAGPFNLGTVVVRAAIHVDPKTAALTVTTDPLPSILDGAPLRLRTISAVIDRPEFMFNPTNCEPQTINATIDGAQGTAAPVSSRFQAANCADLQFKPTFTASTKARSSRADGASLAVKISYPGSGQANIRRVHVELPKALPARLSTLQHACPEATFAANPASCPAGSVVGTAKAITPVLNAPLTGPAYFVSHGGAKFPELILVLQGEGVTIELEGETFIKEKTGVTSSTFNAAPDAPVSSFELELPRGKDSALAAPGNKLCAKQLAMPTEITGQNGKTIEQNTEIDVTGCPAGLQVTSKRLSHKTLTLKVIVPEAGRLVASGKGLTRASKRSTGRQTLELELRKTGGSKARVTLVFTPRAGKQRKKLEKTVAVARARG